MFRVNLRILAVALIIAIMLMVFGCQSQITRDDSHHMNHALEASNYLTTEYASRVDRERQNRFLSEHYDQFIIDGEIDYRLFLNFAYANIDVFIDVDLYEKIVNEACALYDVTASEDDVLGLRGRIEVLRNKNFDSFDNERLKEFEQSMSHLDNGNYRVFTQAFLIGVPLQYEFSYRALMFNCNKCLPFFGSWS